MPMNVFSLDPEVPLLPILGAMQVILLLARYKFSEVHNFEALDGFTSEINIFLG